MDTLKRFLEISPRVSGSPKARRAAEFIHTELQSAGLTSAIHSFEDNTPKGLISFHNVLASTPGDSGDLILLVSHFDTKAGISDTFQGANDSGSSTAVVLEIARIAATMPLHDIRLAFAFFDGEECIKSYGPNDGLHGSRKLASTLKKHFPDHQVKGVILLDMIGDRDLNIGVAMNSSPALRKAVFTAARNLNLRDHVHLMKSAITDDHVPFLDAGYPAVDLIDFEFGSDNGKNDYWHSEEDTLDKVSSESMSIAGRIAMEMVNILTTE